jgi:hypothetical protein
MGEGGVTGFNDQCAGWLPRLLLVLAVAAAPQAACLLVQARRRSEPSP